MVKQQEEILKQNARILLIFGIVVTSLGVAYILGLLPSFSGAKESAQFKNVSVGPGVFTTVIGTILCAISQAAGIATAIKTLRGKV